MLKYSCSNKWVIKLVQMYYQEKGRETMRKYENDVKRLLDLIGGKENIQAVSHCMTRNAFCSC